MAMGYGATQSLDASLGVSLVCPLSFTVALERDNLVTDNHWLDQRLFGVPSRFGLKFVWRSLRFDKGIGSGSEVNRLVN
jgi:hypothetical protein